MSRTAGVQESVELEKLLSIKVHGSFFLRGELKDYVEPKMLTRVMHRLDVMYEAAVKANGGHPFNPRYRFKLDLSEGEAVQRIALQLLNPGMNTYLPTMLGEILLEIDEPETGGLSLRLPEETRAALLARQHGWRASPAELAAIDKLLAAAQELRDLKSAHFAVGVICEKDGIQVQTGYVNPMEKVRALLAQA